MTKEECIELLNRLDRVDIIYSYCIHKGKEEPLVSKFMTALMIQGLISSYSSYAFDKLCEEFNLTILSSRDGRIIRIY